MSSTSGKSDKRTRLAVDTSVFWDSVVYSDYDAVSEHLGIYTQLLVHFVGQLFHVPRLSVLTQLLSFVNVLTPGCFLRLVNSKLLVMFTPSLASIRMASLMFVLMAGMSTSTWGHHDLLRCHSISHES